MVLLAALSWLFLGQGCCLLAMEANALALAPMQTLPYVAQALARESAEAAGPKNEVRRWAKNEEAQLTAPTPYGPLRKTLRIGEVDVNITCPFAFVLMLCSGSEKLTSLMLSHLKGATGKFILYLDETKPGNVLRPEKGRSVCCFYWCVLELPAWLRSGSMGWWPLTYVTEKQLQAISGGVSGVCAALLQYLWSDSSHNFARYGVLVKHRGTNFNIKLEFGCLVADEKGVKEACQLKGAGGLKTCGLCANICNRRDASGWAAHFTADPDKWVQHTEASWGAMLAEVEAAMTSPGTKAKKEECQRLCGVNYVPNVGLLWSSARAIAKVPHCIYWDWMHSCCASGGMGQYILNQFALAIKRAGIPLSDLTAFVREVKQPLGKESMSSFKFEDRIVHQDGAHLRGFASDVLGLVPAMVLFSSLVLEPAGRLKAHTRCLRVFAAILDILSRADDAVQWADLLQTLLLKHHYMYQRVFPQCSKPKMHFMLHLPDHLRNFKANLNCFGPERRHRFAKALGSFCYKNISKTLLTRDTINVLKRASQPDSIEPFRLGIHHKGLDKLYKNVLLAHFGDVQIKISREMRTPNGTFKAGDLVAVKQESLKVAWLIACAKVGQSPCVLVGLLDAAPGGGGLSYDPETKAELIAPANTLATALVHVRSGGMVHIYAPITL